MGLANWPDPLTPFLGLAKNQENCCSHLTVG